MLKAILVLYICAAPGPCDQSNAVVTLRNDAHPVAANGGESAMRRCSKAAMKMPRPALAGWAVDLGRPLKPGEVATASCAPVP